MTKIGDYFLFRLKPFQLSIYFINGKTHHVEVRAFNLLHPHITNPFLHTIGSRLVHWIVTIEIVADLLFGEVTKCHPSRIGKGAGLLY